MPSQAENQHSSQPSTNREKLISSEVVHTRVSELLDNATELPAKSVPKIVAADPGEKSNPDDKRTPDNEPPVVDLDSVMDETDAVRQDADGGQAAEAASQQFASDEESDKPAVAVDSNSADEEKAGASKSRQDVVVTGSKDEPSASAVRIRGRPGGVLIEIDDDIEWPEVMILLGKRLAAAEGFFRGGRTVLEVGGRDIAEADLRRTREMLARHDMMLAVVRSTSEDTLQAALLLGLSTSNESAKAVPTQREMAPVVPITQPNSPYFVHNGTLRSGQTLRKSESVVVVGDVNPGAKVISNGDVMVWGRLRGVAYAGAGGNEKALVAAIEFTPTQLRIGNLTAVAPDPPKRRRGLRFWKKEPERRPEVAHVAEGRIIVEPWDDTRPGRPKLGRRK